MIRLEMNNCMQKKLTLSSGKIDKYVKGKEILSPNQSRVIGQAKFSYSFLGKSF